MTNIAKSITALIGNTPMLELGGYTTANGLNAKIIAKLEYFNPAGSIKDRVALAMVDDAEKNGKIKPGSVIIEPTSGNTGIGLALVAAARGYRVILTMPETMSVERRKLLVAYGAELVLTEGARGMTGAIEKADELAREIPGALIPGQFVNSINPRAHHETTGPEIWRDTGGDISALVACVGTGGTVTGTGEYLKSQNPDIKVFAVEPFESPVLSGGEPGPHGIQGIGAGFVPKIFNASVCDEFTKVKTGDAYSAARQLAKTEGLLAGISSGAALWAAKEIAARKEFAGKNIVVILPDSGERYLSTPLFE